MPLWFFFISTPQTGVDSIMVSASLLGLPFAIFKLISAFILGIIGGLITFFIDSKTKNVLTTDADMKISEPPPKTVKELFNFAIDDLLKMIWRWLFTGIIISAAITTWLPKDLFQNYLGDNIWISMLVVLLVSLPMYVCATASVPIAAALVVTGMPVGAALVFLMAGPASNVATIGAVYRAFGIKKLIVYLGTIIIGSLLCGWLFNSVIEKQAVETIIQHHKTGILTIIAAITLVLLMLRFAMQELKVWLADKKLKSTDVNLERKVFHVKGITCQGCANKLKPALNAIDGIVSTSINVEVGEVTVTGTSFNDDIIKQEIRNCGFKL